MEKLELRFMDAQLTSTDEGLKVSGYVNKTNQWSETLGLRKKFVERILPGTFDKALQNGNDVHFYAEHDPSKILSSTRNGSLSLREDSQGLYMEATISPTSWGKDYHTLIKDGIIRNMSFGMQVLKDSWKKLDSGLYERSISDLYLAEVSAVRNPAYAQSTIAARSIEIIEDVEIPGEETEIENENREEINQMENNIEFRDKLATVLDEILAVLKENQSAKEVVKETNEVVDKTTESVKEIVDKVAESTEKVVEKTAEVVEEVVDKVKEETQQVADEAKDVVEASKEAVKEAVKEVTEVVKDAVKEVVTEEKPADLTDYYKKLLDF